MQAVTLEDELRIRSHGRDTGIQLRCRGLDLSSGPENLVYRAAALVLERASRPVGLEIDLLKTIPLGAGLGGGSSDAAATIVALNELLDLGWSREAMAEIGAYLGSDVPFFFSAPTACVTGRGELVQPVQLTGVRWIVLVNPGFPVSTGWAYRELATARASVKPVSEALGRIAFRRHVSWDEIVAHIENDFEPVVFAAHPVLSELKARLLAHGAQAALLSGSGATVFGVFRDEESAQKVKDALSTDRRLEVWVVQPRTTAVAPV